TQELAQVLSLPSCFLKLGWIRDHKIFPMRSAEPNGIPLWRFRVPSIECDHDRREFIETPLLAMHRNQQPSSANNGRAAEVHKQRAMTKQQIDGSAPARL